MHELLPTALDDEEWFGFQTLELPCTSMQLVPLWVPAEQLARDRALTTSSHLHFLHCSRLCKDVHTAAGAACADAECKPIRDIYLQIHQRGALARHARRSEEYPFDPDNLRLLKARLRGGKRRRRDGRSQHAALIQNDPTVPESIMHADVSTQTDVSISSEIPLIIKHFPMVGESFPDQSVFEDTVAAFFDTVMPSVDDWVWSAPSTGCRKDSKLAVLDATNVVAEPVVVVPEALTLDPAGPHDWFWTLPSTGRPKVTKLAEAVALTSCRYFDLSVGDIEDSDNDICKAAMPSIPAFPCFATEPVRCKSDRLASHGFHRF